MLLVLVGALVWRCQDEPYVAPRPPAASGTADEGTASETLQRLQHALSTGDADAAGALGTGRAAELLAAAADNVRALRLDDVALRYLSEAGRSADAWTADVEVTWRLPGFDGRTAARGEVVFGFADGGRRVASVGGSGLTPLWLQGAVASRRTDDAIVLTTGPQERLAAYLRQATRAVDDARRVLGGRPRLVVEVPASTDALHRTVGAEPGQYAQIAAVTTSSDGSLVPGAPLHVFLNPAVYDALDEVAAQVVMSHEAVHVVTGAPYAQNVPLWLLEGFADYVALRDVDLPLSKSAGQIIDRVRKDGVPEALPTRLDFDAEGHHLGATYEAAWLVCVTLAEQGGDAALVGMYRALVDGGDLAAQLQRRFGWTEAQLTAAWQQKLRSLAG